MYITPEQELSVRTKCWQGFARLAADSVRTHLFEVHRGAMSWMGFNIVFGNDGYNQQESTRQEAELVLRYLNSVSVTPLAFATSADGYSWLLLLDANREVDEGLSVDELDDAVWLCHWMSGLDAAEAAGRIPGFDPELVATVVKAVWPTGTSKNNSPLQLHMAAEIAPQVAAGCGSDIGGGNDV